MEALNQWLEKWEASWLFVVLSLEVVFSYTGALLIAKRLAVKKTVRKKKELDYESLNIGEGK